jgi:hypothetical protein
MRARDQLACAKLRQHDLQLFKQPVRGLLVAGDAMDDP